MPHFVMDCSESVLESHKEEFIIEQIHLIAYATGLFDEGDIKKLNSEAIILELEMIARSL